MNQKGQALLEFLLLFPILFLLVLIAIDVGKISSTTNQLEYEIGQIIEAYHKNKTFDELNTMIKQKDNQIKLEITNQNNENITFTLKEEILLLTPGWNLLKTNPICVERTIPYES